MNTSTQHRACVISGGVSHYGDGTIRPVRADLDLPSLLTGTLTRFEPDATIILDHHTKRWLTAGRAAVESFGWKVRTLGPWATYTDRNYRTVTVGLRAEMADRDFEHLLRDDTDPGVVAMLLDRYQQATGVAWRGNATVTTLDAIRLTWENVRGEHPRWKATVPVPYTGRALHWSRPLTKWENTWDWVHTWDERSAYVGTAGSVDLAWSSFRFEPVTGFDHKIPGYWRTRLDADTLSLWVHNPARPPVIDPEAVDADGWCWPTTPVVKFLTEQGQGYQIDGGWLGQPTEKHGRQSRVLAKWSDQMWAARQHPHVTGNEDLEDAVKHTASAAWGALQGGGNIIDRADWAHFTIDQHRVNLLRKLLRVVDTGWCWPVQVSTDAVTYADDCLPEAGTIADHLGVRVGRGGFRLESTVRRAEWALR